MLTNVALYVAWRHPLATFADGDVAALGIDLANDCCIMSVNVHLQWFHVR